MLTLNVFGEAFEVMQTGEKTDEFRKPSRWMLARLEKEHDEIKIVHGYGGSRPYFIAEYHGFEVCEKDETRIYSNGLHVNIYAGKTLRLKLGNILERGNTLL